MQVPPLVAAAVAISAAGVAYVVDDRQATVATATPKNVISKQECFSCHTDANSLAVARGKRNDPHWLEEEYNEFVKVHGAQSASWNGAPKKPKTPAHK